MAKEIMFYDGATYEYPETLVTAAGTQAIKSFLRRVYKGLQGFKYLGFPEVTVVGFNFDDYVLFARGHCNFYAGSQFAKDSYPFVTEMVRHFVLQIALPQLELLAKG